MNDDFRPIEPGDLEACAQIFYASDDDLMLKRGLPRTPRNQVALLRLFGHISATSPHRAWLAEQDGRPIGFAMSAERDDLVFLAFLFVLPDAQARGLGRQLLERSMNGAQRRAVSIFSVQPVSAALYAMYGMVPRVPMYTMVGRSHVELPALQHGVEFGPIDAEVTEPLDSEVLGFTRAVDHRAWLAWDRRLFGLFEGGAPVGYGYAQASGRLGPVVVQRTELLLPLIGQLMRAVEPLEEWMLHMPGAAAEPFQALLNAGLRLDGPPIIFCATHTTIDHSRYLPATYALP